MNLKFSYFAEEKLKKCYLGEFENLCCKRIPVYNDQSKEI